jgi:hypothetical protein
MNMKSRLGGAKGKNVRQAGIEPATSAVLRQRHNQLDHRRKLLYN